MPTSIPAGRILIGLICCVCTVVGSTLEAGTDVPNEIHHQALDHDAYERQHRDALARLAAAGPNTMDASTSSPPTTFSDHSQIQPRTTRPKTEFQTSATLHPGLPRIAETAHSALTSNGNAAGTRSVPWFPAAGGSIRQGFVRVINRTDRAGEVVVRAFDDTDRVYDPLGLSIGAGQAVHFNSDDLESGNSAKGLSGSTGAGVGDWRLQISSDLDIEVLAYIRTEDGFLTAMHDLVPNSGGQYRVATFNPASNTQQQSLLRLTNQRDENASLTVTGIDDTGESPGGTVDITVPAGRSMTLSAAQLETGGEGFTGALGNGVGKWQLVVKSDDTIAVMNLLLSPTGHLTNLSTTPGRASRAVTTQTAEEAFGMHISPIVQSKCINCHVNGGASGHTRLVFVPDSQVDHMTHNLGVFRQFVESVDEAAALTLNKIQGLAHGGGIQVAADSEEFESMRSFLGLLAGGVDPIGLPFTAAKLFDSVRMEPARRTLYRAALILAGRPPTPEELAPFPGGTSKQLRDALLGMMTGPAFHAFLIRGANDRLLVKSLRDRDILATGHVGVIVNGDYARFPGYQAELERLGGTDRPPGSPYPDEYYRFQHDSRYGAVQAPLELIAHVVENDLPYTEILTADYIMANGATAKAYSDPVVFDDPGDPFEFRPARFRDYRRPKTTMDDYPHAGILNTTSFLVRYPTTPTNRNRARSRWAYYHFLGFDIQNAAPTVTDAVALFDTRNPTMHNPACTVCHVPLDPAAGAFQNYTETGFYRARRNGEHALDPVYTFPSYSAEHHRIEPAGSGERTVIVAHAVPMTTDSYVFLRSRSFNRDQDLDTIVTIVVGAVSLHDHDTGERYAVDLRRADRNGRILEETGETVVYMRTNNYARVPVDIPADARYDIIAEVWAEDTGETGEFAVTAGLFREGDTWYRDMREPGFEGGVAPDADASLQWLARKMASDPRFAEGAVKFWWPAIMGKEVELPPTVGDPDFDARSIAASAQAAEVARLASGFRRGFHTGSKPYNLKDLLAAMVLSPWFRAERNVDDDRLRKSALRDVGARRLLTPAELANKTASVSGYQWGRRIGPIYYTFDPITETSALTREYNLLYGGMDSKTQHVRSRELTATMAAVAKVHAIRSSCPIILREFYLLPMERRRLFAGFDVSTTPHTADGDSLIRDRLAKLQEKLFGIDIGLESEDVDTAFELFVDTLERKRAEEPDNTAFRNGNRCDTESDILLLDGVVDPPFVVNDGEYRPEYVQNDPDGLLDRTYEDPDHLARTWVVVLAYLMMDYRYLYL